MSDPHTVPTITQPYAICLDCGVEHADPDAASEHGRQTMTPTGATSGVTARGHAFRIMNPTPEEREHRRIRGCVGDEIDDAIREAFDRIDGHIERGSITTADATAYIDRHYSDLSEEWADWMAEGNR